MIRSSGWRPPSVTGLTDFMNVAGQASIEKVEDGMERPWTHVLRLQQLARSGGGFTRCVQLVPVKAGSHVNTWPPETLELASRQDHGRSRTQDPDPSLGKYSSAPHHDAGINSLAAFVA